MTSPVKTNDPFVPSDDDAKMAAEASRVLAAFVSSRKELHVELSGDGKKTEAMILPPSVIGMVQRILTEMANGNAITVMPMNAELTTQEAADFLNVSRPFIVKQLDAGAIPHRKVGTHRRISVKDLLKYKHEIDRARHETLDALTAESQRLGAWLLMSRYTALYDACVLYPAPLRDLLMQLAMTDLFRARWSDQIHDEWIRNVLKDRSDLKREDLLRTKELMNENVRDCLVTGYEPLIDTLTLPDMDDRHVLAAAIRGRVDVIVTFNLKDFPVSHLALHDVEAQHPDEFIAHLIDLAPTAVLEAAKRVRARLKNPQKSAAEYLDILAKQGLPKTVDFLSEALALI